jgi:nickel/cobalt exporter
MTAFSDLIAQGAGHAWLFIPSAILLGALHGLEPGHSKTMMAAFIIAVRGTVGQAVLLGLSATLSHTAIVWVIALGGMYLWRGVDSATLEPWFQLASGVIIVGLALWMLWRARREQLQGAALGDGGGEASDHHHHDHDHHHDHAHDHRHADHEHGRGEGGRPRAGASPLDLAAHAQDAHALAHAEDIKRRFAHREVTTGQIVIFGLTGGLIPCPGAITILLLCLQLKQVALGAVLVLCFSIGLALTMVASGVIAALSVRHVSRRWRGFGEAVRYAPYVSGAVILLVGVYVGVNGWLALPR